MEAFALECMKLGLVPGLFVVLLIYLMKDKEHMRTRLEAREDELLVAYQTNIRAMDRLSRLWEERECLAGTERPKEPRVMGAEKGEAA